jgi:hypothetical protein
MSSRVLVTMRTVIVVLLLAACGGKPAPAGPGSGSAEPIGIVKDTRSELEKRRDTACEQLGPKLTACAVADAKAELDAGKITKKEFDLNTGSEVQRKNTDEFVKACRVPMSSRQVRVLEVCFKEEQQCGPLADCLTHLNDNVGK